MSVKDEFRQLIIDEFDYAISKMESTEDKRKFLYYYSALNAVVNRVFNFEFDKDLVFAHFVLVTSYENFNARLKALSAGADSTVGLYEEQFEALLSLSKELRQKIAEAKSFDTVLKKIVVLSYSTTGNGNYVFEKGKLSYK
ncbi:hypothetical protein DSCW_35540 [Desulfosarcina widdelii]|uniref:Uncharacterized protein n=1 Tax=Desulfosarcina widdelii TaxID=947919 RepID=A0A5K7ZJ89_9BACT|nr:hypothetical protein [Desulfosarcina widdelii]BBO76137.1 hypothetical protein DSCW_35540 [Desulfosarcina widdelii]